MHVSYLSGDYSIFLLIVLVTGQTYVELVSTQDYFRSTSLVSKVTQPTSGYSTLLETNPEKTEIIPYLSKARPQRKLHKGEVLAVWGKGRPGIILKADTKGSFNHLGLLSGVPLTLCDGVYLDYKGRKDF